MLTFFGFYVYKNWRRLNGYLTDLELVDALDNKVERLWWNRLDTSRYHNGLEPVYMRGAYPFEFLSQQEEQNEWRKMIYGSEKHMYENGKLVPIVDKETMNQVMRKAKELIKDL